MENVAEQSTKVGGVSGSCWSIVVGSYICDDCNSNDDDGNGDAERDDVQGILLTMDVFTAALKIMMVGPGLGEHEQAERGIVMITITIMFKRLSSSSVPKGRTQNRGDDLALPGASKGTALRALVGLAMKKLL